MKSESEVDAFSSSLLHTLAIVFSKILEA